MLIELHILQNFAPSCLNRDDTNSPKECEFGGYRRARISSQCIKRSIRLSPHFKECIGHNVATRTKRIVTEINKGLTARGITDEAMDDIIAALISQVYCKMEKKKTNTTSVALYLSHDEIEKITDTLAANWGEFAKSSEKASKKYAKELMSDIRDLHSADIALFGRMMAEKPELNVDAACQVAHAVSTNRVNMEMDYFTAVDDLLPGEETGAGMIGIVEYNSSCFYRYANIDLEQLANNLNHNHDLARKAVEGFLRAAIHAIPTGKQNSMAAQNPPSLILAAVKNNNSPWSLANAFIKPVAPNREHDLIEGSVAALDGFWGSLATAYGNGHLTHASVCQVNIDRLKNLKEHLASDIDTLIKDTLGAISFAEKMS